MTPFPSKRELRARRRVLRSELAARKREARRQVQELPAVKQARRRRRIRRALGVALLLLILLLSRCECGPPPLAVALPPPPAPATAEVRLRPVPLVRANPIPLHAGSTPVRRGKLAVPPPPPLAWLDALHLQVSARGPRMAQCLAGASGPGALRWTLSLDAASGTVSEQAFEPVGNGADLSSSARECLRRVLANPAYRIDGGQDQPLPHRVSMVIEF